MRLGTPRINFKQIYLFFQMSEDSSLTTHSSSSNYSDAAERHPVSNNIINVGDIREELFLFFNKSPEEGETWCLISRGYLDKILQSPIESSEKLLQPDTLNVMEDAHQESPFYKDSDESNVLVYIPSEAFKKLKELFGVCGKCTERAIIKDPLTGVACVEKHPPYFYVHTLNKSIGHGDRKPKGFFMSLAKTFSDLRFAVHEEFNKDATKCHTRLWFISSDNADDLEANVPISTFISNILKRHLISPLYYGSTLRSQLIDKYRYHVLLEVFDESKGSYPVDSYLETFDLSKYDVERRAEAGGQLGLANLGNTCYMNSALQCVLHIPEIDQYFYYNLYERELNTSNPIGYNGHVAVAFGSLLHKMFNQKNFGAGYVSPRDFKYTVGHYSSMFRGFQQQDSQEFLSWLLDALHEDLNRIQQKPYCEKPELRDDEEDLDSAIARLAEISWSQHKKRNDSVIVDLFTGLYESTLICPDCSKTSITFDPFNDITLPLPVNKKWYHTFNIVNLGKKMDNIEEPIMKLEVELDKTSNFDDLLRYLSSFLNVPQDYIFLFEIFNNFFFKDFRAKYDRIKFFPNSDIIYDDDDIYVYIIPHNRETDVIVPVVFTSPEEDASYRMANPIGIPVFIVLERENEIKDYRKIQDDLDLLFPLLSRRFEELQSNEDVDMAEPGSENETFKNEESGYPQCEEISSSSADSRLGYRIKVYRESNVSSKPYPNRKSVSVEEEQKSVLSIPSFRPNFNNLPLLFEDLIEVKPRAESPPKGIQRENDEGSQEVYFDTNDDDYVVIESNSDKDSKSIPEDAARSETGDDSDNNESVPIGLLFDSVDTLPREEGGEINNSTRLNKSTYLVTLGTTLVCELNLDVYQKYFANAEFQNWTNVKTIPNAQLEKNKKIFEKQQNSTVSLYDCFKNFGTPEVLGDYDLWYCPRCKDHKKATKTISIWSIGDVLAIHLKRFQSVRSFSDKVNIVVDFPIEGLDMSEYVSDKCNKDAVYDLIAVDNHFGGLGGGHYTSCAKNYRNNEWYYFNDSRVTKMEDSKECVSGAAYLLFYRRRTADGQLGGQRLTRMIKEGREHLVTEFENLRASLEKTKDQVKDFSELHESDSDCRVNDTTDNSAFYLLSLQNTGNQSPSMASLKKLRSNNEDIPLDQDKENVDQNHRKQRLISKDALFNKSISIKLKDAFPSASDMASPLSVSSEDNTQNDNVSMLNSENNNDI